MDTIITIAVVAGVVWVIYKYVWPKGDVNNDGKVDINDVKSTVTSVADVNKDGKVDVADAAVVAEKVVEKAKTATKKAADVNKDGKVDKADAKAAVSKAKAAVKKPGRPKKTA